MPSFCGSLGLLVVLGAVMVFGSPLQHLTENVVHTHDAIADVLELKDTEISGRPLFNSVIKSINTACMRREQVQLMNETLDIYARIFSSILHRQPHHQTLLDRLNEPSRSELERSLMNLQETMGDLKKRLSALHHPHLNHEDVLKGLRSIKVDSPVDQRRALAQFKEVYRAASVIASRTCASTH